VVPGTVIAFDAATRRLGGGVLVGGSPLRVLRLSPAGAEAVDRLAGGGPVPDDPRVRRLAGQLVGAGLAHPVVKPRMPRPGEVTAVVPVKDDRAGLVTTLHALARVSPWLPVVVVDDGSEDGGAVHGACGRFSAVELVRCPDPGGPAAARNRGWRRVQSPVVAFVDAGCMPSGDWLETLLAHLDIGRVAAAAPRVVSERAHAPRRLAAYEAAGSRLDMGGRPAPVRPGSWVPFVPTATLVVARQALVQVGGFDEALTTGEDVDLVWRLHAAGWDVRYCPEVTVGHPCRPGWRPWLAQRFAYGRSAPALAARHGSAVAPADVPAWSAGVWALAAGGRYRSAAAAGATTVATVAWARAAAGPDDERPTGRPATGAGADLRRRLAWLAAAGHFHAGRTLARACRSEWWPLLVVAALASSRGRRVAVAAMAPLAVEWAAKRPALDPVTWTVLGALDDAAYGAGVWRGCAGHRSGRALLPRLR
jgi:mycofactocin system glycosyltransferase